LFVLPWYVLVDTSPTYQWGMIISRLRNTRSGMWILLLPWPWFLFCFVFLELCLVLVLVYFLACNVKAISLHFCVPKDVLAFVIWLPLYDYTCLLQCCSVLKTYYMCFVHLDCSVNMMMGQAPHSQLDADLAGGMGMPDNGPKLMSNLVFTELRKPETEDLPGMGQFNCLLCQ